MKQPLYIQKKSSIFIFIFFLFYSINLPLTGDDWGWGSQHGMTLITSWYKNYNGRYLSNTLEFIMTRYFLLRVLFFSIFSTLLVTLSSKLFEFKNKTIPILLSLSLFLLIPLPIFAQTFGWFAGYVNYVFSIVLLLFYLTITKNIYNDEAPKYSLSTVFFVIPLGFLTQLNVEHVTLFSILTSLFVIIYSFMKFKKSYLVHWAYFLSSLVGSIYMFSNPSYLKILKGKDSIQIYGKSYRTIDTHSHLIINALKTYEHDMSNFLFYNNLLIQVIISGLILLLILKTVSKKKPINFFIKPIFSFIIISFDLYSIFLKNELGDNFLGKETHRFDAGLTIIYFLIVILSVFIFVHSKQVKIKLSYYLSGIILLTAPFAVITPYGPRCVFGTYTFMILFILQLLSYVTLSFNFDLKFFHKILVVSSTSLMLVFAFVIFSNGHVNRTNSHNIESALQNNSPVITIKKLPFPQYQWMSTPYPNSSHVVYYKNYYKIPQAVKIKIAP